jgi:hypothetical protein
MFLLFLIASFYVHVSNRIISVGMEFDFISFEFDDRIVPLLQHRLFTKKIYCPYKR